MKGGRSIFFWLLVVALVGFLSSFTIAGTTGKISGVITDENGEGIPGATVMIEGTSMGAAASFDGSYVILDVPPGTYNISAQTVGYNKMTIEGIEVKSDVTTEVNFQLTSKALKVEDVTVVAERKRIDKYVTSTEDRMTAEEIKDLPVSNVSDVLRIAPGFVQQGGVLHARGGRGGEIAFMVDDISVRDYLGGYGQTLRQNINISRNDIEELTVLKGNFDAEYGEVQSAIIKVVQKEGSNKTTSGMVEFLTDDLGFSDLNRYSFNNDRLEWNLSGPVPGISDQLFPALGLKWPGEKMSYFVSFSADKSNTWVDYNNYDSPKSKIDYGYETFLGIKIPHRRSNQYTGSAKLTWKMDSNSRYKLSLSYRKEWQKFTSFSWRFLYTPETAHKIEESKEYYGATFTFSPVFLRNTFGELKINRTVLKYEDKPGGILPGDFVPADNYETFTDSNNNGVWDPAEPFIDTNGDGFFGEPFVDNDGDGVYNPQYDDFYPDSIIVQGNDTTWVFDLNRNGQYDSDIGEAFSDANGNGVWDPAEEIRNDHYFYDYDHNGIYNKQGDPFVDINGNGVWDAHGVWEPFTDVNGNGVWDPAEPFTDENGNGFWDNGEPYTDTNGNGQYDFAEPLDDLNGSGAWDDWEPYTDLWDNGVYDPGDFAYKDSLDRGNGVFDPQLRDVINEDRAEPFTDGDVIIGEPYIDVDLNGVFNGPPNSEGPDVFLGAWDLNHNGQHDGPNDPWSPGVPFRDLNNNGRYDPPNGIYDYGEPFVDLNRNGRYDDADGFWDLGFDQWALYHAPSQTINTFGLDLTSQVSKQHEIKSGIKYTDMKFVMREIQYPHLPYDGLPDGGSWPDRGVFRDFYTRTPKQGSFYIQDKMEYGEMIAKIGFRYDFFLQAGEVKSAQFGAENLTNTDIMDSRAKFSPRMAFSFPVTDKAKLYFNYGHFYQLPQFRYFYRRPTQASNAFGIIGNPNLDFQKTIAYEMGIQYALSDDYTLTISGFYKDYYGLLNSIREVYGPISNDVYGNIDYARTRGFELELEKRFIQFFAGSVNYQYTWAFGKNSSESADYFRRFYRQEIPIQENPLDWDIRHQITVNGDVRAAKGNHPKFGIFTLPDDWVFNFIWQFKSGRPFTPDVKYPGLVLVGNEQPLTNSERMPYYSTFDVRLDKNFQVWKLNYTVTLRVDNLFDHKNVSSVYSTTGLPYTNQNANGQILTGIPRDRNPANYEAGRQIMVGLRVNF